MRFSDQEDRNRFSVQHSSAAQAHRCGPQALAPWWAQDIGRKGLILEVSVYLLG